MRVEPLGFFFAWEWESEVLTQIARIRSSNVRVGLAIAERGDDDLLSEDFLEPCQEAGKAGFDRGGWRIVQEATGFRYVGVGDCDVAGL